MEPTNHNSSSGPTVYWRVEGSLLDLTVVRPVAFFTWNAQTFAERFRRRGQIFLMALLRPFLYSTNRKFATRVIHTVLRGVTRDRLDLLGEEFFQYKLKPHLKERGVQKVQELVQAGAEVVLVSQGLEHVMRPLAQHLGRQADRGQPPGVSRWYGDRQVAEAGDPAARGIRAHSRRESRRSQGSQNAGTATEHFR